MSEVQRKKNNSDILKKKIKKSARSIIFPLLKKPKKTKKTPKKLSNKQNQTTNKPKTLPYSLLHIFSEN